MKKKTILHLIPNAHLDPVWLWNFQEGLNEGIRTCRTILDLMDEFPELTFSRGEAAIYRHIEKHDPATFARIADFVRAGRWEVIGGTEVQSDTNLPATETFARHDLQNVGVFIGLGDHGGGPTRRQLLDIRAWAEGHPEVTLVYSGLHKLLDALRREVLRNSPDFLPVVKGELNFCLRGCYSSVAKFKFLYRKTENALLAAERADAVVRAGLGLNPGDDVNPRVPWNAVLFNTFHDILPGTSIERAVDEQIAWIGGTLPRSGSFASLRPASLQLLALKPAFDGDGLVVRVRETSGRTAKAVLDWLGERLSLGTVPGKRIATFMLRKTRSGWKAAPTDIAEV